MDKSPGPNGFTMALYQECWEKIKEDVTAVFRDFHPKEDVTAAITISDYRPISLVIVFTK